MKKAKIMLAALAIFAVIGGALAFKTARFTSNKAYYTTFSTVVGGVTYSTIAPFCTTSTVFINPGIIVGQPLTTVYRTTTTLTKGITLYKTSAPTTDFVTLQVPSTCVTTATYTTLAF
jgi:hypothetical protein